MQSKCSAASVLRCAALTFIVVPALLPLGPVASDLRAPRTHTALQDAGGAIFTMRTDGAGFRVLHRFDAGDFTYVSDLVLQETTLYGTVRNAAYGRDGAVFKIEADGSGYTLLHHFTQAEGAASNYGLVLLHGVLYGVTQGTGMRGDGQVGYGTIFRLNPDGSGFAVLHRFHGADGREPCTGLVTDGTALYGTNYGAEPFGAGAVFRIDPDGSGFTILHHIDRAEGLCPMGNLVLRGKSLYGINSGGSLTEGGILYRLGLDGTGFTILHSFSGRLFMGLSGLATDGTALYGSTLGIGPQTLFKIGPDGERFCVLHDFPSTAGGHPYGNLVAAGATLYGTLAGSGTEDNSAVFKMKADGSRFGVLHTFDLADPGGPKNVCVVVKKTLFGIANRP